MEDKEIHVIDAQHGIFTFRNQGVTFPEKLEAFIATGGASDFIDVEINVVADQYNAGPFPRWNMLFRNRKRGAAQAEILAHWYDLAQKAGIILRISFVAHSNGCDVVRHAAIELYKLGIHVTSIIFIAAPLNPNIDKIGLRPLLESGTVISNWCSPDDKVLAKRGSFWGAVIRWPYKNAGKIGFTGADEEIEGFDPAPEQALLYNRWFYFSHSEYFDETNLNKTFETIIKEI